MRLYNRFTTCLDSIKTGLRVQPEIFALDSRKWNRPRPYSMQKMDESDRNENRAELPFKRPKALGSFVLDSIKERGEQLKNQIFSNYRVSCKEAEDPQNSLGTSSDLSIRYREALLWATKVKEDGCKGYFDQIKKIEGFVSDLLDDFVKEAGSIIRERRGGEGLLSSDKRYGGVPINNYEYTEDCDYARAYTYNRRLSRTKASMYGREQRSS